MNGLEGLLALTQEDKDSARNMGMLQAGLGILARNTSRNPMPAIAAGGLNGLQGYQESLKAAQAQKLEKLKLMQALAELNKQNEYTLTPGSRRYRGDEMIAEVPMSPKEFSPTADMQNFQMSQQNPDFAKFLQAQKAGQAAQPYYTPIPTDQGLGRFNNRTGNFELVNNGGIVKPSDSPALQAAITRAEKSAEASVKSETESKKAIRTSDQLLTVAKQAEKLLDSNPTQSGIGSAIDAAGRMVGATSESSMVASQLEALSGWMVANVPRMEGPQSNYDVENYRVMAGKVGDRTVPIRERKAALKEVVRLQEKYKELNGAEISQPTQQFDYAAAAKAELERRKKK